MHPVWEKLARRLEVDDAAPRRNRNTLRLPVLIVIVVGIMAIAAFAAYFGPSTPGAYCPYPGNYPGQGQE